MKKSNIIILTGLLGTNVFLANYTLAQSINPMDMSEHATNILPTPFTTEDEEFSEAIKAVKYDYTDTDMLELFIERYPASKHYAAAVLELEKAQTIQSGAYYYAFATPLFSNFTPNEKPYQFFYENQKELTENSPNFKKLRNRYEQLIEINNPTYLDEANYYLGYIDYAEGKYDDALNRFKSLPQESKYIETTQFYMIQIDYSKGNYENVLKSLEHPYFGNLHSKNAAEINRIKAECLARTGNKKQALSYFEKYIGQEENPIASSAYNCAVLAYENGDNQLAQKAAIKAAQNNDKRMQQYSYMLLGQSYMLTSDTPKAKMAFEQAASMTEDSEVQEAAAYNMVVLSHDKNYSPWGDEVVQMENFLNTFPKSKYADNVSTYLTEVFLTTKNYDAALASIRKIKEPNQTILNAKRHLLYQCGIEEYVNGSYVMANNHFTECLDTKASDDSLLAQAHYWRGESRYHLDYLSDAASDYSKAIEISHDNKLTALCNYSLGYVNYKKQKFEQATTCFNNYISNDDTHNTETYYDAIARLGDCAYYNRNFASAESFYAIIAETESNTTPYSLYQHALMLGLQKKYSEKQNSLDRLIARYPSSDYIEYAWLEKGNTSILQNENNAAINAFKYVVENYPYSSSAPTAAVQLAMAYNNSGQTELAQKVYEMVAEKYPNTDEATTALQDLKVLSTNALYIDMPKALEAGDFQKVIDNYNRLQNENIDFRDLQKMQLMTAKAYFAQDNAKEATTLLEICAEDMRTEAGAEAKYILAQNLFDNNDNDKALAEVSELIQSGTSHQYWLARAIILMSDISVKNEDTFTAAEYLKSLKSNYKENDDIQTKIEERLTNIN